MILFDQKPSDYVLVNNPVLFTVLSITGEPVRYTVKVKPAVSTAAYVAFEGIMLPVGYVYSQYICSLNISEILQSHLPEPHRSTSNPYETIVEKMEDFVGAYTVEFKNDAGDMLTFNGKYLAGGIGKELIRQLAAKNTDIFEWKLFNTDNQPFLITRTFGKNIFMRLSELSDFYFFATDSLYGYEIAGKNYNYASQVSVAPGNIYRFNLENMNAAVNGYLEFARLYAGLKLIGNVTILQPVKTPHKLVIKFLNSFGVFEKMELTGRALLEPEITDAAWMQYDAETDDYFEQNDRLARREIIIVETGYKTKDELMFLRDMLQSARRFLIFPDGMEREVRITAESFSHALLPFKPESVKLKIRAVESDINYSPLISEEIVVPPPVVRYETEIEFDVKIDGTNVGVPVSIIALAGDPAKTFEVSYGDGQSEIRNFDQPVLITSGTPGTPYYYEYHDHPVFKHVYAQTGVYRVHVESTNKIVSSKFTTLYMPAGEWVAAPVGIAHIVQMVKYKSDSITNLNYAFAGLINCLPAPDFIIEAPLATDAFGAFHSFGTGVQQLWTFRADLLSQLTALTNMTNMFRECGIRYITEGFFDAQTKVSSLFETFKRSSLGVGYYQDWTLQEFLERNLAGTSFIPMTLLRNMPNLKDVKGMFNALVITGGGFGVPNAPYFGNWYNLSILIRAELFWNGKNKGNAAGTIEEASFMFGKINRVSVEKDLFRHVANSLQNISAIFWEANWPRTLSVGQNMLFGWGFEPGTGWMPSQLRTDWINTTTMNVQEILASRQFPKLELALNAFCAFGSANYYDPDHWGFNGNFGGDSIIAPDSVSLDNSIIPHFPAIKRTAGTFDGFSYQYGFGGMLRGLRFNAGTPDADHLHALTTNPIQY